MKNQRLILITAFVTIITIILLAIPSVLSSTKPFEITNFDQLEHHLTSSQTSELETFIHQSLIHTKALTSGQSGITALIRPSSFSQISKDNITNYQFLIDIDSLRATYVVSFALMRGEGFYESPVIDCPLPAMAKYPDNTCRSEKSSTLTVTLGQYLPFYYNLPSGELITVTRGINPDQTDYLSVRVSSCGNTEILSKAQESVVSWISSLGYSADNYQINIPEYCDGEH